MPVDQLIYLIPRHATPFTPPPRRVSLYGKGSKTVGIDVHSTGKTGLGLNMYAAYIQYPTSSIPATAAAHSLPCWPLCVCFWGSFVGVVVLDLDCLGMRDKFNLSNPFGDV